ncbi:hypothetical protein [Planococcus faecalis]|nr:hypothetical protein [Planococcus faecalis]
MYYGKEMVILPFSSDQFNIAYDVEKNKLGSVLDPNNFSKEELANAFNDREEISTESLQYWKSISRKRGADYAAKQIMKVD